MSLDLDFDAGQGAIGDAVAAFCRGRCPDEVLRAGFPEDWRSLWRELAELGVLGLATPEGEGGALELTAACEALGRAVFPGPLAASVFAAQLLPEAERRALVAGEAVVSVGKPPLLPFAPLADLFVETDGVDAWLARPRDGVEAVATLGGEPWGRARLERERALGPAEAALALHDVALAAYLAAAGERLLDDAVEHARTRRQFGRAIGEFQAVAHPLADCAMGLSAARTLARMAACLLQDGEAERGRVAAAHARLSSVRAALETAHTGHQVFGALGITLEGPAFHVSRRLRQLASQPPDCERARENALAALGLAPERAA